MFRRILFLAPVIFAVLAVIAIAAAIFWFFVTKVLMPPDHVVVAAGRDGGGYHSFAKRYESILAWDQIKVTVLETAGSVENARLLESGEADVALIQGGVPLSKEAPLEALAAVFLEPLLVLHPVGDDAHFDPSRWSDLRVAAGEPDSGTRAAVEAIIDGLEIEVDEDHFLSLGGVAAVEALRAGQVDVAVFVAPVDAPYLQDILTDPNFRIRPMRDAQALARRVDFVRIVDIPPSGLDYNRHIPAERIELTAMVASLVAQEGLHPALVNRLVRAAQRVHGGPSILTERPEFPSADGAVLPVAPQAETVLRNGPNPMEKYVPYWIAAQITRVTVVLVPLVVLLLPIIRATPGLLAWRLRSRVYRYYNELVQIEDEAASDDLSETRHAQLVARIDELDKSIAALSLPPRYREYAYSLRLHLDLVRKHLGLTPSPDPMP